MSPPQRQGPASEEPAPDQVTTPPLPYVVIGLAALAAGGLAMVADPGRPGGAALLAVAAGLVAVLVVQVVWTLAGGEPVRKELADLHFETASALTDLTTSLRGLQTLGITRLHHQRGDVTDEMAERWRTLGSTATEIDLMGLTMESEWLDNPTLLDILRRVASATNGRVRILVLGTNGEEPRIAWDSDATQVPVNTLSFQARIRQPGEHPGGKLTGLLKDSHHHVAMLRKEFDKDDLEVRELRVCLPYALTVRIDSYMYVAPYRAAREGRDSFVMEVADSGEKSVFRMYREEFDGIWEREAPTPSGSSDAEPGPR